MANSDAKKDWERQQLRVFSKWSSLTLGIPDIDISKDFQSGKLLVELIEKLSMKKINITFGTGARSNNRLNVLQQLNTILNFLRDEKLHLTVSAENIYDGDETLIMGLIWTLILKYQITNKRDILNWTKEVCQVYDIVITNLTTSWKDGRGLCALLHSIDNSLIEMKKVEDDAEKNLTYVFNAADTIGIPKLLEVDDLAGRPDERIVLTYISYFYRIAKHGIPVPKKEPTPPPSPKKVEVKIVKDDSEIKKLRAEIKKLKSQLKNEKARYKQLHVRSSAELQYLVSSQKALVRKFQETKAEYDNVRRKLKELHLKLKLQQTKGFSDVKAPTGDVTLVIASIQGYAKLWEKYPEAMGEAVQIYNKLFRERCAQMKGYEVKYQGGTFTLAFQESVQAVRFTLALQQEMPFLQWPKKLTKHEDALTEHHPSDKSKLLFSGLRARIVAHKGKCDTEKDPTSGRMDYFGKVLARTLALNRLCAGGQTLISSDVYKSLGSSASSGAAASSSSSSSRNKTFKNRLGNPDITELGEIELPDMKKTDQIVQLLPKQFSERKFAVHPSPENLEEATLHLQAEIEKLEQKNTDLQKRLAEMEKEAKEAQARAAELDSFFAKNRAKTDNQTSASRMAKEFDELKKAQFKLEKQLNLECSKNKEMDEYMRRLNGQLEQAVRASRTLTKQNKQLKSEHEPCAHKISKLQKRLEKLAKQPVHVPVVVKNDMDPRYITRKSEPEKLHNAPLEVRQLLQAYPHLKVRRDEDINGNWIIGEGSYDLRSIKKLRIDSIDLLPTIEEREAARHKRQERMAKRRSSTLSRFSIIPKKHDSKNKMNNNNNNSTSHKMKRSQSAPKGVSSALQSKDITAENHDFSDSSSESDHTPKKKKKSSSHIKTRNKTKKKPKQKKKKKHK